MTNTNEENCVLYDGFGAYTSSPPFPPVPPFPCALSNSCTPNNRICDRHKCVLFVKNAPNGEVFEIPYGNWENWLWYKQRIHDCTGIPVNEIRLVYAGAERDDLTRHSGLQMESTIHMVLRKPVGSAVTDKNNK